MVLFLVTTGPWVPAAGRSDEGALARADAAIAALDARDLDGRRWTREVLRGRVVLIDFWATWCAPCLNELPRLRRLQRAWPDDFLVVGISVDAGSRRTLVSWLQRQAVDWPQIHDGRGLTGELARRFDVPAVPYTVLLDRDGRPVAINLRAEALERAVARLVRRDPPGS